MKNLLRILALSTTLILTGCFSPYVNSEKQNIPSNASIHTWSANEKDQKMIYLQTYGNLEQGIKEAIINYYSNKLYIINKNLFSYTLLIICLLIFRGTNSN